MKKVRFLVLVVLGFMSLCAAEVDYSKMSANELNQAFIAAVKSDLCDEVPKLVQAGADVNTLIHHTQTFADCDYIVEDTAFGYAVLHDRPNMVKTLLKFLKVEKKKLNPALDIAIEEGYSGVVEELVKWGVDINCIDKNQNTPFIKAVACARATGEFYTQAQAQYKSRWQDRRKIIQILLKAGADVRQVNKRGRTALMEAVIEHDLNTVESLLQMPEMTRGSYLGLGIKPINYADSDGNTALILALQNVRSSYYDSYGYQVCRSSQGIINALLKTPGIDAYHANKKGDTAIKLIEALNKRF